MWIEESILGRGVTKVTCGLGWKSNGKEKQNLGVKVGKTKKLLRTLGIA